MRRFFLGVILAGLVVTWLAIVVTAQCRNGQCSRPAPTIVQVERAHQPYGWIAPASDPGRLHLYRGGIQVGAYDLTEDYYRPCDVATGTWGDVAELPCALPVGYQRRHHKPAVNFGVDLKRLQQAQDAHPGARYLLGDQEVTAAEARKLVSEGGIPAYKDRPSLVVIGPDTERKRVDADFAGDAFAELRAKVNYWSVPPDHWSMKAADGKDLYVTAGHPTVYLLDPTGKVLHRQDAYAGAEDLQRIAGTLTPAQEAQLSEARRDNSGKYDPKKDTDLRTPLARIAWAAVPTSLIAGGALALGGLGLYSRRRRAAQ